MSKDAFKDAFLDAASQVGGAEAAALTADEYVDQIERAVQKLEQAVVSVTDNAKTVDFAKGDAAEPWHAETYNIDAARQGLEASAEAPRETVKHGPDVVFDNPDADPAQLKFYGDAPRSARAVSDTGYEHMTKVIPADQLPEAKAWLETRADQLSDRDPEAAERYRHAAETITDHLDQDGAQSRPLTLEQSEDLVADARDDGHLNLEELGLTPDQIIQLGDGLRETMSAGLAAAEVAMAVQAATYVVAAVQRAIDQGSLTPEDLAELAEGRGNAVAKSAFTGTVAGGLAMAASSGALGDAAEALAPEAISLMVVMSVNAALAAVKATRGEITWDEAGYRMAKSGVIVAGGTAGAMLGSVIFPGVGTVVGSILGAAVARAGVLGTEQVAMALAVSNGWTYFGVVSQDYRIPEATLRRMGWDTFQLDKNTLDLVQLDTVTLDSNEFERNTLDPSIRFLHRGIIGVRRVGYV